MSQLGELLADDRGIEGLPIRLVIAFIVGVAALSVMLNMVSGIGGLAVSELDAKPGEDVIKPGKQTIDVTAVDSEGNPVSGATVIVRSGSASLDGVVTATTGPNGTATLTVDPELGPNQVEGTLEIELKPPAGSKYTDERENTVILVVRN